MPDVSATLPTDLIAGNTWQWDLEYADYPAPTWTATAYFENAAKTFSVGATAESAAHRFTVAAATSAAYPAGRYQTRVRVTDGSQVFIAESGWCEVEIDPAAAGTRDTRTWNRRMLEAVQAFLEGSASTMQASMSIQGRALSRWPRSELWEEMLKLEARVRDEESSRSAGRGRDIKVRYGSP